MSSIRFSVAGALAVAVALALASTPAPARTKKPHPSSARAAAGNAAPASESIGTAGSWTAYVAHDKTGQVCYLAGQPEKSEAAGVTRQQPMAMVTHRPAENIANVVSFVEGYPLKEGSDVTLDIGGRKFDLFTNGDSAWARTSDLDQTIVAALAKGRNAVVKGEPQKGRETTDIYSLSGFSKALALIDKACGIEREGTPAPAVHRPARLHPKPHPLHH